VQWQRLVAWPIAVAIGALAWALAGWLVCVAFCLIGWLPDISQPLSGPLGLATSLFLLANGSRVVVAGVTISIIPLLLTIAIAATGVGLLRVALRHGFAKAPAPSTWRVAATAAVIAGTYGVATAVLAGMTGLGSPPSALVGGVVIGFVTAWLAVAPPTGWHMPWPASTPAWVRALPRACGAGLGVLAAGGALVVCIALVTSRQQVGSLEQALIPGVLGSVLLAILQAFWAPTMIIWGVSWLTGAGFALGAETSISPISVQLGILPSLPVFGAVPAVGAPPGGLIFWLVVPVAAGAAAAWVAVRAQETGDVASKINMRIEGGAAIGCATGIVVGLLATVACALTRGDLGQARLTGLGPLITSMVLLAPALLGFGGVVAGIALALRLHLAHGGRRAPAQAVQAAKPKPPPQPKPLKPPPQPWLAGENKVSPKGHIA